MSIDQDMTLNEFKHSEGDTEEEPKIIDREGGIGGDLDFLYTVLEFEKIFELPTSPKKQGGGAIIRVPGPYSSWRSDYRFLKDATIRVDSRADHGLTDLVEWVTNELKDYNYIVEEKI